MTVLCLGAARSWTQGVPVNLHGSRLELVSVSSDVQSDFDYIKQRQGAYYFNDCLTWVNHADVAVLHAQFIYTMVNRSGEIRRKLLPLDIRYRAEPGETRSDQSNCRDHAYANGASGLWLVGWVNEVDFADGTSWHAPLIERMQPHILEALQQGPGKE